MMVNQKRIQNTPGRNKNANQVDAYRIVQYIYHHVCQSVLPNL